VADLLFLLITLAFFTVAVGFVSVCDRVIGPDLEHGPASGAGDVDLATGPGVDPAAADGVAAPATPGALR
jgi:hypothetical protein